MPKISELSEAEKDKIEILHRNGYSSRNIAIQIGRSQKSVLYNIWKLNRQGSMANKARPGRPRLLSRVDIRKICVSCKRNRFITSSALKEVVLGPNSSVSISTVQRVLRKYGLRSRRSSRLAPLRRAHRKARLEFARRCRRWTEEQWSKVLWSDEKRLCRFRNDGRARILRFQGERLRDHCVVRTVTHGGGSVMVWGCFSMAGVGTLCRITTMIDRFDYLELIMNNMVPSGLSLIGDRFIFQQDNDPKHASHVVRDWFRDPYPDMADAPHFDVLAWPSCSPDLNPIEDLWDEVCRRLSSKTSSSSDELWENIQVVWYSIEPIVLETLVKSMPGRIAEVIRNIGGRTRC